MSIDVVSGNAQQPLSSAAAAAAAPLQSAAAQQTAAVPAKHDTVELTGTALAKSLKLSGQNPAQIALAMGTDIKTIDGYLSIQVPVAAMPTTKAPAAPAGKPAATDTVATPQPSSPAEEAAESAAQKATETLQGKK